LVPVIRPAGRLWQRIYSSRQDKIAAERKSKGEFMDKQGATILVVDNERAIGYTVYDGADIGECLATAARIKEGDFESWHTGWTKTAQRVQKIAK